MFHFKNINALLCTGHIYRTLKQWMEKYVLASDGKKIKIQLHFWIRNESWGGFIFEAEFDQTGMWGEPLSIWNYFAELKNSFIVGNLVKCRFQFGKSRHCPWRLHSSQAPREVKATVCVTPGLSRSGRECHLKTLRSSVLTCRHSSCSLGEV